MTGALLLLPFDDAISFFVAGSLFGFFLFKLTVIRHARRAVASGEKEAAS